MQRRERKIILASASPRRRELLAQAGFTFEVKVSQKEEDYTSVTPDEIVKELSLMKAEDVAGQCEQKNVVVIGADTIVAFDGQILGKPADLDQAVEMIRSFQGKKHQVYTGVTVIEYDEQGEKSLKNHAIKTDVYVNPMTEEEVLAYVREEEVLDKAGAYGIQGAFARHIEKIDGDYYNVVGLPISYIYECLK